MKNLVFKTSENWAATVLRMVLGIVIFSHGAQYLLGWFGGFGLSATLQFLTTNYALPKIVALAVICIQFFGSIMLFTGFATRVAALGLLGIFIGMAFQHVDYGFYMNWSGENSGEGFEFHVLVLGMCAALLLLGGGTLSVDRLLTKSPSK